MTWVKLCSIKCEQDIKAVIDSGANAAGFLVGQKHSSNDFISAQKAKSLAELLPRSISPVLVTHLSRADDIVELQKQTEIETLQLHGSSSIKELLKLKKVLPETAKLIYAVHVTKTGLSVDYKEISKYVDMLLLDSCNTATNQVGGTGQTHDWNTSAEIVKESHVPVILAGGLNPVNVKKAVEKVKPFGVDVNSGVKNESGYRSYDKCIEFVRNAQ